MATSDSDDFESADEEIEIRQVHAKKSTWIAHSTIGSDTDDDNDCISTTRGTSWSDEITNHQVESSNQEETNEKKTSSTVSKEKQIAISSIDKPSEKIATDSQTVAHSGRRERPQRKAKDQKPLSLGATKLGTKVPKSLAPSIPNTFKKSADREENWKIDDDAASAILERENKSKSAKNIWARSSDMDELEDMPEELKSNKKFKEVFNSDGWENFDDGEDTILAELENEKGKSVEDMTTSSEEKDDSSNGNWASWSSWGVSSLLNTASASVSTLTTNVSHGLSLLTHELAQIEQSYGKESTDEAPDDTPENQPQGPFGFGNIMSGVSSITKLVESTGTKVIAGGLGTLETIGKKTMEVLQEGDPGLKKKRAFFMNEGEKPILSQILREAKEKAGIEEKTLEEKQQARKVHFETLFDDFQGLVHLEALEMLSKQSTIKIQQRLVYCEAQELISLQETLDEVKELCNLDDEDEEDGLESDDLKNKLKSTCIDLGVPISYDKLYQLWEEAKAYVSNCSEETMITDREIFQNAISTLAQFTAYCVERFHKTAELILIKERRSTVNEADALVQLTKVLSAQIGLVANLFAGKISKEAEDKIDVTPIFLEATNASSYVQDAFRLLIPIMQVGAI